VLRFTGADSRRSARGGLTYRVQTTHAARLLYGNGCKRRHVVYGRQETTSADIMVTKPCGHVPRAAGMFVKEAEDAAWWLVDRNPSCPEHLTDFFRLQTEHEDRSGRRIEIFKIRHETLRTGTTELRNGCSTVAKKDNCVAVQCPWLDHDDATLE